MISLYNDTCRGCGDRITKGDSIHWSAGGGPRCLDCGPERPDEARGAATAMEDAPGYVRMLKQEIDKLETTMNQRLSTLRTDIYEIARWARGISEDLGVRGPDVGEP